MKKGVFAAVLVVALIWVAAFFSLLWRQGDSVPASVGSGYRPHAERSASESVPPETKRISIAFAGDIMLARGIERGIQVHGSGDYSFPYAQIGDVISSADIGFGNLETSVSERGENVGSIYSFRTNPAALPALKAAGFDVVSVANNHIWDWGRDAFFDTLDHARSSGIMPTGGGADYASAHAPAIIERNGVKVAFLAYTNLLPKFLLTASSAPAVAFPTATILADDVEEAKELGADIVVASFHWGEEYTREHNAYQEQMAKAAIDAGALIVAGHHPHTIQEIERYKDGLILYSLGNFVFDQNFDDLTQAGLVVRVTIKDGAVESVEPLEIRFNGFYQPYRSDGAPRESPV